VLLLPASGSRTTSDRSSLSPRRFPTLLAGMTTSNSCLRLVFDKIRPGNVADGAMREGTVCIGLPAVDLVCFRGLKLYSQLGHIIGVQLTHNSSSEPLLMARSGLEALRIVTCTPPFRTFCIFLGRSGSELSDDKLASMLYTPGALLRPGCTIFTSSSLS
jgi:hypothetical protein